MKKKLIALIGAVSLLSACETASQKVVSGTAATSKGSSASAASTSLSSRSSSSKLLKITMRRELSKLVLILH